MPETDRVSLDPAMKWVISPRAGVMTDRAAAEIMEGLRGLGVRALILRAPVDVKPLEDTRVVDLARRILDAPDDPGLQAALRSALWELDHISVSL